MMNSARISRMFCTQVNFSGSSTFPQTFGCPHTLPLLHFPGREQWDKHSMIPFVHMIGKAYLLDPLSSCFWSVSAFLHLRSIKQRQATQHESSWFPWRQRPTCLVASSTCQQLINTSDSQALLCHSWDPFLWFLGGSRDGSWRLLKITTTPPNVRARSEAEETFPGKPFLCLPI